MALRVPLEGVFERFGSQHVYVVVDGIAHRRAVKLGPIRGGLAEVIEGVEEGDLVVTGGVTRVVDRSKVLVVPPEEAAAAEPNDAP